MVFCKQKDADSNENIAIALLESTWLIPRPSRVRLPLAGKQRLEKRHRQQNRMRQDSASTCAEHLIEPGVAPGGALNQNEKGAAQQFA